MRINNILIAQPTPTNGSPYTEIVSKFGVTIDFLPFFKVEPLTTRDFRTQKICILDHTAIVFSAKSTIDAFFKICEETRVVVPETMKYFCSSESIALYLQKHIVYRKRKIFFGTGTIESVIESIGAKHKAESFLIASTDCPKTEVTKLFSKAKLKHSEAVFNKTTYSDLTGLDLSKYQMLIFYSPSDVKSLQENFPEFNQGEMLFATYGPSTAKAMKDAKLISEITAPTPEAPSIAQALLLYFEKNK